MRSDGYFFDGWARFILALVEDFALHPSSDPAGAGPPSPAGEGFGAGELGRCGGEPNVVGGGMPPALRKVRFVCPK